MKVIYQVTEEKVPTETAKRITYGITGYSDGGRPIVSIRDVTTDKAGLLALAEAGNRLSHPPLSPRRFEKNGIRSGQNRTRVPFFILRRPNRTVR